MRDLSKYRGIFPAFYACYGQDGEISPPRVRAWAEWLIGKGVQGLYVNGSSGECIYLGVEERKAVLESVMEVARGRVTVIAHVACNNTRDSMVLAAHAQSLGVDAIAAIPPIYFKLPEDAIRQYWNDISSAAPDTDFVLYNIPQFTGVALSPELFHRMLLDNPRVIGVKNSSVSSQDIQLFRSQGDVVVFNGPDEQLVSGLAMGAQAGIGGTYSVMPELYLKIYALMKEGKVDQARAVQYAACRIIARAGGRGNMYAILKEALRIGEGLDLGGVRKPLPGLAEGDREIARDVAEMVQTAQEKYL